MAPNIKYNVIVYYVFQDDVSDTNPLRAEFSFGLTGSTGSIPPHMMCPKNMVLVGQQKKTGSFQAFMGPVGPYLSPSAALFAP